MAIGIVCVSANGGIGCKNKCLFSIPADREFFHNMIANKNIIVGRTTYENIPAKVLKQCRNVFVFTHGCVLPDWVDDAIIIGGSQTYRYFDTYCTEYYVTVVDKVKEADSFFTVDLSRFKQCDVIKSGNYKKFQYVIKHYQL